MQLGMVGLGRMGAGLVRRLHGTGTSASVYDVSADAVAALEKDGRRAPARSRSSSASSTRPARCG